MENKHGLRSKSGGFLDDMKLQTIIFAVLVFAVCGRATAQDKSGSTAKGISYRIISPHAGERIKLNDVITFDLSIKTKKDSVLMSSYQRGKPFTTQVQQPQTLDDLMDVFTQLTAGDSARIAIPVDSLFKNREMPPYLSKHDSVLYLLKIRKVQTLEQAMAEHKTAEEKIKNEEAARIVNYVASLHPAPKMTASGLYYQILQPTVKRKPLPGDTLLVNYIGRTLDGKVFDTNLQVEAQKAGVFQQGRPYEPFQFVVKAGQVIPGWDEGFLLLHEGEKARLIIPSSLAYGAQGGGSAIPPYNPLIFDVELLHIMPAKHPAVPQKTPVKRVYPKKPVKKRVSPKKK